MVNSVLSMLLQASHGPVFGLALDTMLPARNNRIPRWCRVLFWCCLFLLTAASKIFLGPPSPALTIANTALGLTSILVATRLFYAGSIWHKLGAGLVLMLAEMSAELGILPTCLILHQEGLSMDPRQLDMVIANLIGSFCSNTAMFFSAFLWRKLGLKQAFPRGSWVFPLISILLFVPAFSYYAEITRNNGALPLFYLIPLLSANLLNLLLICLQFRQAEKDRLAAELAELKHQSQLEQQYYQQTETHREEISRIRHDYNNHLSAILGMLQMDQKEQACQALSSMLDRVAQTRDVQYCGIPIVNAILSEKAAQCRKHGILLHTDLQIDGNLSIDQLDLCSVFSNLLDNAIRACRSLSADSASTICLCACMRGDFLIIRCDNPCSCAPSGTPAGTGLGLKILGGIARRYHGSLQTEYADGAFTAKIVLMGTSEESPQAAVHS